MRIVLFTLAAFLLVAAQEPKKADPKPTPEKALEEARTRWNKAAEGVTAKSPLGVIGFTWEADYFPHPTFKGGSAEGYGAFAKVLVKFLEEKGNFDYLAENNLFDAKLRYLMPNAKKEPAWTFSQLVTDFSNPKGYGDHDEATRKALKAYAEKIAERTKKDAKDKGKP